MKNEKNTPYISPKMEIVSFECSDILTTSNEENDSGYESDDNVLEDW